MPMRIAPIGLLLVITLLLPAQGEPPAYAQKQTGSGSFSWRDEIRKNVPPLRHERGNRLPMILWEPGPAVEPDDEFYKELLARGFTQHIHLDETMIPAAQALQRAGSPVIMMQGAGGQWPASLAGDAKEWAHQFDNGYTAGGQVHACPAIAKGWAVNADRIRATLGKFKEAGVKVDAVWMDWEGDPAGGPERYEQALHCARCRETLPPGVLADAKSFDDYCWRRFVELTGAYLAAPVEEVFPGCSTTNWHATVSTPARPVRNWSGRAYPPVAPPFFTASNPVAYGNTVSFKSWKPEYKLDREHVDQFYMHLLLREVSDDAANRLAWTPRGSVPWVCRWCPDDPNPKIPVTSRECYREALRHLWLRGITGMQVFNPVRPGYEAMALAEVQDAAAVYDEMLAYREFLEGGIPLCLDVPKPQDSGVVWSGLRKGNQAIVRVFKQSGGKGAVTVEPWPGSKITLVATREGKTWLLVLGGKQIKALEQNTNH